MSKLEKLRAGYNEMLDDNVKLRNALRHKKESAAMIEDDGYKTLWHETVTELEALRQELDQLAAQNGKLREALKDLEWRTRIKVRENTVYFSKSGFGIECCRIILDALCLSPPAALAELKRRYRMEGAEAALNAMAVCWDCGSKMVSEFNDSHEGPDFYVCPKCHDDGHLVKHEAADVVKLLEEGE